MKRKHFFTSSYLFAIMAISVSNCNSQVTQNKKIKFVAAAGGIIGINVNNLVKFYGRNDNNVWTDTKMRLAISGKVDDVFGYTDSEEDQGPLYIATYEGGFVTSWKVGKNYGLHLEPSRKFEIGKGYDRIQFGGGMLAAIKKSSVDFFSVKGKPAPIYHFTPPQECTDIFIMYYRIVVVNNSELTFYTFNSDDGKWEKDRSLSSFTLPNDCKGILPFNSEFFMGIIKDKTIDVYHDRNSEMELMYTFNIPNQ